MLCHVTFVQERSVGLCHPRAEAAARADEKETASNWGSNILDKIIVWIWMLGQHKYLPVENNYRKPRITTRPRKRINLILNTGSFKYIKFGSGSRILPNFYPGPGLCFQFRTFKKKYLLRKKKSSKTHLVNTIRK